ncbi:hypothetical protein ACTFIW_008719 [Dictyostelium discoideum]
MGYFQKLINPEHAKYTAFITHIGKFEYSRMPQEFNNLKKEFEGKNIVFDIHLEALSQVTLIIDGIKIYSVVDTTFFNIGKPTHFQEVLYSSKHKKQGIKLEVCCNISDGRIKWLSNDNGILHSLEIPFEVWRYVNRFLIAVIHSKLLLI